MPDMILRPATTADTRALSRLGTDSFVAAFGHLYAEEDLNGFLAETHSPQAIARELSRRDARYCLAETDGGLAGYCKLVLACGWPEHARGQNPIELKQLYAAPGTTGRGVGTALMAWVLDQARAHGADEIQLSVWNENTGAQRFYARHGFTRLADITFRVGSQTDHEFLFARPV